MPPEARGEFDRVKHERMVVRIDKFTDDHVPLYGVIPADAGAVGSALSILCDLVVQQRGGLTLPLDVQAAARVLGEVLDKYKTAVPQ